MSWMSELFGQWKREKELEEEVRSHLEMAARERVGERRRRERGGRCARQEFGNVGLGRKSRAT